MSRPLKKNKKSRAPAPSLEKQVELAMSSLDPALTQEYFRALEVTPNLVRRETKISDFLRVEEYNPELAAKRLARYWKTRKLLFGERWLLPMAQTGSGCLTPNQIEILRSGFLSVVNCSKKGAVMIMDFASLPRGAIHLQAEILFYFLTLYPGKVSGLYVVRHGQRPPMTVSGLIKLVRDSAASTDDTIDVVRTYEEGREHLLDYLGYEQKRVSETNIRTSIGYIAANSVAGTLDMLTEKGYDPTYLPACLGGRIDKNYFDNWVRARLSVEDIMSGAPIRTNHSLLLDAATASPSAASGTNTSLAVRPQTQRSKESLSLVRRPDETPEQFAKRKNALYVRRNYRKSLPPGES